MSFLQHLRWRPGIGDPTWVGWFIVIAYGLTALLAWRAAQRPKPAGHQKMWLGVAVLMGCLCLNKQLDLQSLFTDIGRVLARQEGWYKQRRSVQAVFVIAILIGAGVAAAWIAYQARSACRGNWLLAIGVLVLITFIVVRAISFHHADVFLRTRLVGAKLTWILELTGIFLIGAAAARAREPDARNGRSEAAA